MYCFSWNQTKGSFRVNKLFFIFSSVLGTFILASIFLWDQQPEQKRFFISSQPNVRISAINSKWAQTKIERRTRADAEIDSERRALRSKERFNLMEEEERGEFSDKTDCTIDYANANRLQQDHPCVIELIRRQYLHEPAPPNTPLNLKYPKHKNPSAAQSQAILRLLGNLTNGFFVECGGFNGEALSNTLYMERYLNWTGILIEPDNITFPQLIGKKRKSWALPVCLSLENYPTQVTFNNTIPGIGGIVVKDDNKKITEMGPDSPFLNPSKKKKIPVPRSFNVQCFPLYSILLAVNRTAVDFISLDVKGHEFRILKTVPWHKVDAKVLSVEWSHVGEGEEAMSHYMNLHGFIRFGRITETEARDVVYFKDYLEDYRNFDDYE